MNEPARLSADRSRETAYGDNATAWDGPGHGRATTPAISDEEQPAWISVRPVSDHSIRQGSHRLNVHEGWHGMHCTQARESCQVRLKRATVSDSLTLDPSPAWFEAVVAGRPAPGLNLAKHPRHCGHGLVRGTWTPSEPTGRGLVRTEEAADTLDPGLKTEAGSLQPPALDDSHMSTLASHQVEPRNA